MATYKVIQDIEAEDKLLGPLSFRQFVYFLIAAFFGYLNFIALTRGAWPVLLVLGPPMAFCLFFAWPWTPDQPTEVWALARIRFLVKPRKRIWNQSGIKEFVTITAPKKIERVYTDGLSQTEVRSRLQALAHTIDSRGWVIKNSSYQSAVIQPTDRLLDFSTMPQEVSNLDLRDSDDILDEANNPTARNLSQLISASSQNRRDDLIKRLNSPQDAAPVAQPQWFTSSTGTALPPVYDTVATVDEQQLPTARQARSNATKHLKRVQPVTEEQLRAEAAAEAQAQARQAAKEREAARTAASTQAQSLTDTPANQSKTPIDQSKPVATRPDPAILNLAHDNNMDVATLAREAKRVRDLEASNGEVSISLH